jgi:hypothetical protein
MDSFASRRLDKVSLDKYEENRFEMKSVTAYRVNRGQFHETLKLVSKSIVVQRIDSIPNLLVASFTERDLILEHFFIDKIV